MTASPDSCSPEALPLPNMYLDYPSKIITDSCPFSLVEQPSRSRFRGDMEPSDHYETWTDSTLHTYASKNAFYF